MQVSWLPEKVCKRLDKLNRDFLWSNNLDIRKIHLVGWDKVTRNKKDNGLGLRKARFKNEALLSKICWKLLQEEKCVWSDIVKAKYLKNSRLSDYITWPSDSPTWKGIVKCMALISPFIRWKIGNGKRVSFWFDNWLGYTRLCEVIQGIEPAEYDLCVADLIDEVGVCNLSSLSTSISAEWRSKILAIKVKLREVEDRQIWSETANESFTCHQSAYKAIHRTYSTAQSNNYNRGWIWKLPCNMKIKYFAWLACQKSLATNLLRKIHQKTDDSSCSVYPNVEESVFHILRDCSAAKRVWLKFLTPHQWTEFSSLCEGEWLKKNLVSKAVSCVCIPLAPWSIVFVACIWIIWKARNHRIFKGPEEPTGVLLFQIKSLAYDMLCIQKKKNATRGEKWIKPKKGWVKLNVDGRVLARQNSGAAGGVLRDDKGSWIRGFVTNIPQLTVLEAELEAIRQGLSIAWEFHFPLIEIETDSREAYMLISNDPVADHPLKIIIEKFRELLMKPWRFLFRWIPRTQNRVADALICLPCNLGGEVRMFPSPPSLLISVLAEDVA